ncbi:hypothetical protein HL653_17695 [Sphingomonas sp. AP4-R1]|uniref:hypothetical protein n=1 Tax=Sphingomonas sp. AP4-R1 TaxID=2735134 RepID=UPI001493946D|nr:hypothetical protein [Sphingomonas sp. AP4-R1]QJU59348.1 hypothetical protein HL653_17695 [Sphingomonas sp. AP4-R1]
MDAIIAPPIPAPNPDAPEDRRARAAAAWQAAFDPDHLIDQRAIAGAAAQAPLSDRDGCPQFDPVAFADLVTFIAEMPF